MKILINAITLTLALWMLEALAASLRTQEQDSEYNQRVEAIRQAKAMEILKYMNESVHPCDDFYQFACGNWKIHYPADKDTPQTDSFSILGIGDFHRKLSRLLSQTDNNFVEMVTERKVKDFYASCLEFGSLNQTQYNNRIKEIIKEFGVMPALTEDHKWLEADFDWLQTIAEIAHKYGLRIIVGYTIEPLVLDNSRNVIILRAEEFSIENNFDSQRAKYGSKIANDLKTHLDLENKIAENLAIEIVDFEGYLWNAKQLDMESESEPITLEDAHNKYYPDLDLKKLFNSSYGSIPPDVTIDVCPYIESLIDIMGHTSRRVVANYIFYKLLEPFMFKIPDNTENLHETCVEHVEIYFPRVVSYLFYSKNNLTENEKEFNKIWQNIKSTLEMAFQSDKLEWFDDEARENSLQKLQTMQLVVPSYMQNNFDEEYANLTIQAGEFLENLKALQAFKAVHTRASLNEVPQLVDYGLEMYSPVYVQIGNVAIVPVSVLQTDFFWSKFYPKAFNYGHIGFLISHEILHGFSGHGHMFDHLGNIMDTWNIEEEFRKRRQCLYDQYQNYTFGGIPLPQDEMQEENTADNGGVLLAFEAYRQWYEDPMRKMEELDLES